MFGTYLSTSEASCWEPGRRVLCQSRTRLSNLSSCCAALQTSTGFRFCLHHWINERIHQHEEKLSARADQWVLKSVSFNRGDADGAGNGSGHRLSLASKAAFGKLRKRTFWKAAGVLPGLVSEPLHLWSTGRNQQLNTGWAFNQYFKSEDVNV